MLRLSNEEVQMLINSHMEIISATEGAANKISEIEILSPALQRDRQYRTQRIAAFKKEIETRLKKRQKRALKEEPEERELEKEKN